MSEEPRLPAGLLPPEKHYQAHHKNRWGSFALIFVVFLVVCFVWRLTWRTGGGPSLESVLVFFAAAVALLAIGRALWLARSLRSASKELIDAVALLESGRAAQAEPILDALCVRVPVRSPYHALFVFHRGVAFLRAGKPDRALSLFASVLDAGSFANPKRSLHVYYPSLLGGIAAAYAMKGDTETAERWQGMAHDHVTQARAGLLLPLDVYLGIRAGRNEIVVRDAEAMWADASGCLTGSQMQALRLICAFGLSCVNYNGIYDDKIRWFLDGARPCRPGQFDYLGLKWPELRAFLEANDFSAKLQK